ncbi:flagellar hook-associated protein FlgK [uncultured Alsobacter sp.]|uniref:flagellar hook-associated protein FlgK n=1 Tax=uncultured Alsobacter sp. TaxID=1748258 RepID=UPI0025F41320|nr:flagellar hook-associated protein FlgK [uncultured Alsobacter sp.]
MSLSTALSSALSGLRTTQTQMQVVSGNVANVDTPGYSRRSAQLVETTGNGNVNGVRVAGVQRALDGILQRELRTETSGSGYTGVRATYTDRLQSLFGQPGDASSLPGVMSAFTTALQDLANDPASSTARTAVLSRAATFASTLNSVSNGIQQLRADTETAISADVARANELLKTISSLDQKVGLSQGQDPSLLDQRDAQINELAKLMDLNVTTNANGTVNLSTQGGLRLFDPTGPVTLAFDGRGTMSAGSLYSSGASRGVGTITATTPGGTTVDALAQGLIRSGEIAGLLELRDKTLVDAQSQVDELAAGLASAMGNKINAGAAATAGAATGFDVDTTGIQPGNVMTVNVTVGGVPKTYSFINLATGGTLPANATSNPNDIEVAVDFSNPATAAAAIGTALGSAFTVSNTGSTIRILDDGAAGTSDVSAASASITLTGSLQSGSPEFALFVDGANGQPFTGSFANGSQKTGLAARLIVNPAVKLDPNLLVKYAATTPSGDTTRPALMLDRLTSTKFTLGLSNGSGGTTAYTGTMLDFSSRVVAAQGEIAAGAARLDEGQKVVQSSIESRFSAASGVSIDQELTNLVQIQNAYSANARIMSAVKEMMDLLMRI